MLLLIVGLAGGCRSLGDFERADHAVTDWDNPAVGQMAMRMYLRSHQESRQPLQRQLLEQVGNRLAAAANRPAYDWRFELVDDPQPDIVVFPAGNVVVTEGMIAACHNEAEFAAALAHEMSHMLAGHPIHHAPPRMSGPAPEPRSARVMRDPQDEIEADSIALSLLARAGYEPEALVSFWRHADANPERIAFVNAHAERDRQLAEIDSALAQARQIYHANPRKQGQGIQIVRDESARGEPTAASLAGAPHSRNVRWTASTPRRAPGRADPHGAAKPSGWNADLFEDGDWLLPVEGEVRHAGYEWSPSGQP